MSDQKSTLSLRATAEQVVCYLASHVLGTGWSMTFGLFDTSYLLSRLDLRRSSDPAWRMCWAGLFEEAQNGDVGRLVERVLSHTESIEGAGRTLVQSEAVATWLSSQPHCADESKDISLLISSRVVQSASGIVMHIPMMDFRCEPSEWGLTLVTSAMRRLGQKSGAILLSGQSYHYYGFELLSESQWEEFMYRCLLLTPFSDPRYIGHRLLARTARLRITDSRAKPMTPHVVAFLD